MNNQKGRKLTQKERTDMFLSRCFILCPRCLTIHPLHTKTCTTCMEVLDVRERVFQKNLNKSIPNKYNLIRVELD